MKLDGEKLLVKLEQVIETGMGIASDFGENGDAEGYIISVSAIDATKRVIELIKSGDYTIKDKG